MERFDILGNLPAELVDLIFSFLSLADLATVTGVSHKYRLLTNDEWRRLCRAQKIQLLQRQWFGELF